MSRILIVEDEEAIADLEKDYLELSDFEVAIENTGDAGLATALAEDFDLIILDLMLPGMDGFEVCKRIREKKDVPILMVSAKKDDICIRSGLFQGRMYDHTGKDQCCESNGRQNDAPGKKKAPQKPAEMKMPDLSQYAMKADVDAFRADLDAFRADIEAFRSDLYGLAGKKKTTTKKEVAVDE